MAVNETFRNSFSQSEQSAGELRANSMEGARRPSHMSTSSSVTLRGSSRQHKGALSWIGMESPRDGKGNYRAAVMRHRWGEASDESRMHSIRGIFTLMDDGKGNFRSNMMAYWFDLFEISHNHARVRSMMTEAGAHWHADVTSPEGGYCVGDFNCFANMVCNNENRETVQLMDGTRRMREVYSLFDIDGGGSISIEELTVTLSTQFRRRPTQLELAELIKAVDVDGSGHVDFREFCLMMLLKHSKPSLCRTLEAIRQPIEDIHVLFRTFCVDQGVSSETRQWSIEEFGKVMRCLGQAYTDEELMELIVSFTPAEANGVVSFSQFAITMCNQNPPPDQAQVLQHLKLLKKLFVLCDTGGEGALSVGELNTFLQRLGCWASQDELHDLLRVLAPDNKDIGFSGFIELISGTATETQVFIKRQVAEFREAYALFDHEGKGEVKLREFMAGMNLFGEAMARHGEELLETLDEDGSGGIDFVEFLAMMISVTHEWPTKLRSQLVSFRELFNMFDSWKRGLVTPSDFATAMLELGMPMSQDAVEAVMESAMGVNFDDSDPGYGLNFINFVHLFASVRNSSSLPALCRINELREAFAMFDTDGSGMLDLNEIWATLGELGTVKTLQEVAVMVAELDVNMNGQLDFIEFIRMISIERRPPRCHSRMNSPERFGSPPQSRCASRLSDILDESPVSPKQAVSIEEFTDTTPHGRLLRLLRRSRPRSEARHADVEEMMSILRGELYLNHIAGFGDQDTEITKELVWEMELEEFPSGSIVQQQGESCQQLYVVLHGHVDVWLQQEDYARTRTGFNALWLMLRPPCLELDQAFRMYERYLPSESCLEEHADKIRSFGRENATMKGLLYDWTTLAHQQCSATQDVRLIDHLARSGKALTASLRAHAAVCDELRSSFVLQRAHLQGFGASEQHIEYNEEAVSLSKYLLKALQEFLARFEEAFAMETSSDAWREPPRGVVHHPQPGAAPDQDAQYGYNLAALMPGHCIGLRVTQTEPQLSDLTFTTRLNIVANPPKGAKAFRAPGKAISDANIANEEALCRVICAKISRSTFVDAWVRQPLELLNDLKICQGMPEPEMLKLALQMHPLTVARQEKLACKGQRAEHVYFIKQGEIKIKIDIQQLQKEGEQVSGQLVKYERRLEELSHDKSGYGISEGRRAEISKLKVDIAKQNKRLRVLQRLGAIEKVAEEKRPVRDTKFSKPKEIQPLKLQSKQPSEFRVPKKQFKPSSAIVLMGRLDIMHECQLDKDGTEVWGADYVAETTSVHVFRLPRALFKNTWIQHNMTGFNEARSTVRHTLVQKGANLLSMRAQAKAMPASSLSLTDTSAPRSPIQQVRSPQYDNISRPYLNSPPRLRELDTSPDGSPPGEPSPPPLHPASPAATAAITNPTELARLASPPRLAAPSMTHLDWPMGKPTPGLVSQYSRTSTRTTASNTALQQLHDVARASEWGGFSPARYESEPLPEVRTPEPLSPMSQMSDRSGSALGGHDSEQEEEDGILISHGLQLNRETGYYDGYEWLSFYDDELFTDDDPAIPHDSSSPYAAMPVAHEPLEMHPSKCHPRVPPIITPFWKSSFRAASPAKSSPELQATTLTSKEIVQPTPLSARKTNAFPTSRRRLVHRKSRTASPMTRMAAKTPRAGSAPFAASFAASERGSSPSSNSFVPTPKKAASPLPQLRSKFGMGKFTPPTSARGDRLKVMVVHKSKVMPARAATAQAHAAQRVKWSQLPERAHTAEPMHWTQQLSRGGSPRSQSSASPRSATSLAAVDLTEKYRDVDTAASV